MKPMFRLSVFYFAVLMNVAMASQKTAVTSIYCQSFELLPSNPEFVVGVGNETAYFSTFNGTAGYFLVSSGGYVSGELRPRSGSPGIFEGAYETVTPLAITDYGSYAVNVPTTDTTGIGVPDVLNYSMPGTFYVTGSGYDTYEGGLPFSISLSFSRAANSAVGSYTATLVNTQGGTGVLTGQFYLVDYQGTIIYTRGSTNTMALSLVFLSDTTYSVTGTTSFTVVSANQVNYPAFTVTRSDGYSYSVLAGTMTRTGNTYLGSLKLADGNTVTPWADYTNYQFRIVDNNNTSGDGIPDLSDPLAVSPTISAQPVSQAAAVGTTVTFSVTAAGAQSYQWYLNGTAILGATGSTLSIANVQGSNAGTYSVQITNPTGTVTSNSVTLAVTSAPAITTQPASQAVNAGNSVTFNAGASGTPTPTYQWYFNGQAIAGATAASYAIAVVQNSNAGSYAVTATNTAGTVTSNTAALTVAAVPLVPTLSLLNDQFTGPGFNSSLWRSSTPYSDSGVAVTSGNLSVINGAGILSTGGYSAPIEVDFAFAFTGNSHDSFRVYTRSGQFNSGGYGANGVGVSFRIQDDSGNTSGNIALEDNGTVLATGTFPLALNTYCSVRLVDSGSSLTLYLNSSSTPLLTAATGSTYGTKIVSFNRQGAGSGSYISAGSVTALDYVTVWAIPLPAQPLLGDQFTGPGLNSSNWRPSTPYSDSSAAVSSGNLSVSNGAGILSTGGYPTPIEVDFAFAFTGGTYDSFRVYTRSGQFNSSGYGANGVGVSFRIHDDSGNTSGNIALEDNGTVLATGTFSLALNTYCSVRLVDTGSSLTLYLNSSPTPLLAAATASAYGTKIVSFNRQGAGSGSFISAGSVTALDNLTVWAVPLPSIIGQPVSQTVNAGGSTTLSVAASGAASYQWQLNGSNITGATNATLTLSNIGTIHRKGMDFGTY